MVNLLGRRNMFAKLERALGISIHTDDLLEMVKLIEDVINDSGYKTNYVLCLIKIGRYVDTPYANILAAFQSVLGASDAELMAFGDLQAQLTKHVKTVVLDDVYLCKYCNYGLEHPFPLHNQN